jgi:hypothetical protein
MSILSDIADAFLLGPIAPAVAANKTSDIIAKGITGVWAAPSPQETGALKTFSNVNMAGASLAAAAASLGTAIPALAGGAAAGTAAGVGGASAAALPASTLASMAGASAAALPASTLASMAGASAAPSAAALGPAAASGAAAGAAAESIVPHIISTIAPAINSAVSTLPSAAGSAAGVASLPPSMGGASAAPASSVLPETSLVNSAANHIIDTIQPIENSVLSSVPGVPGTASSSLVQQLAKVGQGIGNKLMSSGTQTAYPNLPPEAPRPSLPPLTNTSPLSPRSLLSNPMAPINLPPVSMPQPTMESNNFLPQISGPMPPPPPPFAISDIRAKINILPGADQMDILLNNIYNKLKGSHGFSS